MTGIVYALIVVLAWGTWLAPAQNIPFKNQQIRTFYVAAASLALAVLVSTLRGWEPIAAGAFWMSFAGGLIWAVSGLCAFTATSKIGMAKGFGIWAPINIIVSMLWGGILFHEFPNMGMLNRILMVASVVVIIMGVLMIIFARGTGEKARDRRALVMGLLGALGAGILWGSYFIPIKVAQVSMWTAAFPLSLGIFVGSALLVLITRQPILLEKGEDYFRVCSSGVLWGIGNYAMLLLVAQIGAGRGFTISQLSVVVSALISIFWLKDPRPGTRAAALTFVGCVLATLGGVVLGNLN